VDQCDQSAHSDETETWARRLAECINLPHEEVDEIALAAKLHDIGKAVLSKEILTKPGLLTDDDWQEMHRHPEYSAALMEPSAMLNPIRLLVRWHHERYDGKGYPDKISGPEIPLGARILSVADAFSSMIVGRVYRQPVSYHTALDELVRHKGKQFDPDLVGHMVEIVRTDLLR
jgi:HD-GYP domain-containing protein (c-di-GMP phosphodiesterase class II)